MFKTSQEKLKAFASFPDNSVVEDLSTSPSACGQDNLEAANQRCFIKSLFCKISKNSQENSL